MKMKKGFTLVELLLSIAIILGISGIGVVSYVKYNERETLRQAALVLKSDLRNAQSKAISGEKNQTICGNDNKLLGWCASTNPGGGTPAIGQSLYEYYGVCGNVSGGTANVTPFPGSAENENRFRLPAFVTVSVASHQPNPQIWFTPTDSHTSNKVLFSSDTKEAVILNSTGAKHDILGYCLESTLPSLGPSTKYIVLVYASGEIVDEGFSAKCPWDP
jgi:prepilin-type N-terminal cleavage/methylation domain-containing protein